MGTEKNSVLQAYLGQFRTDILTYKQYKDTKKNLDNNKKGKKSQQKREQRKFKKNMYKRDLLTKIEQVIKIPQCKCIIFYDKNKNKN